METIKIEIPILCRSKKNSQQIVWNKNTHKPIIIQSKLYKEFEEKCGYFLKKYAMNINTPVNVKCTFIFGDRKKRDITNLENAIADILVKYNVLEDDNYNIIASWDGTKCYYEKGVNKTIIEISEL